MDRGGGREGSRPIEQDRFLSFEDGMRIANSCFPIQRSNGAANRALRPIVRVSVRFAIPFLKQPFLTPALPHALPATVRAIRRSRRAKLSDCT